MVEVCRRLIFIMLDGDVVAVVTPKVDITALMRRKRRGSTAPERQRIELLAARMRLRCPLVQSANTSSRDDAVITRCVHRSSCGISVD